MYILQPTATDYLSSVFNFPITGLEQDWDVEFADSNRLEEFITYLENEKLSQEITRALIALIIASYNEYLEERPANPEIEKRIEKILIENFSQASDIIDFYVKAKNSNDWKAIDLLRKVRVIFLQEDWYKIEKHLRAGVDLLPQSFIDNKAGYASGKSFQDFFEAREYKLALDQLEGLGEINEASKEFWQELFEAANLMKLEGYKEKYLNLLKNND